MLTDISLVAQVAVLGNKRAFEVLLESDAGRRAVER